MAPSALPRLAPVRPRRRAVAGAAACLGALLVLACGAAPGGTAEPEGWVEIRGERIGVEIADTRAEQELGLGERDALAWDRGMLFVYDRPGFYGFWMKGMRFDIDIVWIRDGRIVDITPAIPHAVSPPLPTYRPAEAADRVLEVRAGSAVARGWRVGDRVLLPAD